MVHLCVCEKAGEMWTVQVYEKMSGKVIRSSKFVGKSINEKSCVDFLKRLDPGFSSVRRHVLVERARGRWNARPCFAKLLDLGLIILVRISYHAGIFKFWKDNWLISKKFSFLASDINVPFTTNLVCGMHYSLYDIYMRTPG